MAIAQFSFGRTYSELLHYSLYYTSTFCTSCRSTAKRKLCIECGQFTTYLHMTKAKAHMRSLRRKLRAISISTTYQPFWRSKQGHFCVLSKLPAKSCCMKPSDRRKQIRGALKDEQVNCRYFLLYSIISYRIPFLPQSTQNANPSP